MTLQKYLARRRYWEFALFLVIITVSFFANLSVELIDQDRAGVIVDRTVPVVLEATSHVAMALAILLFFRFDHYYPIRVSTWARSSISHMLFSVVFSLVHVTLMYWSRIYVFKLVGVSNRYHWDDWPGEFLYEFLKDFRTYITIVALVYLYRFVLLRLQGEAGFLSEEKDAKQTLDMPNRFLVKKLGREFLVRIDEIDWIESCGNYVNLHVGTRLYPLRETMTRIDDRLAPLGFQRVHRSAIVNLSRVSEIVAYDTGDGQAKLQSDALVPVSRRFRQALRERVAND